MHGVILGFLLIQPLTIYELHKAFLSGVALFYTASLGSIQAAIKKLLDQEAIVWVEEFEGKRRKKRYSVTDRGREAFFTWMYETPSPSQLETAFLSRLFFLGHIEDKDRRRQLLDEYRVRIEADLRELELLEKSLKEQDFSHRDDLALHFTYQLATLDYGLHSHRAALNWIDGVKNP